MYNDPRQGGQLRHDACDRDEWGAEMLDYLRDHDQDFERWRHEQLARLDADYREFRRERFHGDFGRWRAGRAASLEQQQRTGRVDQEAATPSIGMPLSSAEMPPGLGTLTPDADAPRHHAALHGQRTEPQARTNGP